MATAYYSARAYSDYENNPFIFSDENGDHFILTIIDSKTKPETAKLLQTLPFHKQ